MTVLIFWKWNKSYRYLSSYFLFLRILIYELNGTITENLSRRNANFSSLVLNDDNDINDNKKDAPAVDHDDLKLQACRIFCFI